MKRWGSIPLTVRCVGHGAPPLPYTPRPTHDVMDAAAMQIREEVEERRSCTWTGHIIDGKERVGHMGFATRRQGQSWERGNGPAKKPSQGQTPCFGIRDPEPGSCYSKRRKILFLFFVLCWRIFVLALFSSSDIRGGERI